MKNLLVLVITAITLALFVGGCDNGTGNNGGGGKDTTSGKDTTGNKDTNTINWIEIANTNWYSDDKIEFTITTAEQLAGLAKIVNSGNEFLGKTIKLGANITLNDTINWENWATTAPKRIWTPIGISSSRFKGEFYGMGYVVSGMYINNSEDYQGLLGFTGNGAIVKSLGVVAFFVKGKNNIGGLSGQSYESYYLDCYSIGKTEGIELYTGGLAGSAVRGEIIDCYAMGNVKGNDCVGGLLGSGSSKLINSFAAGNITGVSNVGGLVGFGGGEIDGCYAIGNIKGNGNGKGIGGLVGGSSGSLISNCYATGNVENGIDIGGLVGSFGVLGIYGEVNNCYSIGEVTKGKGYTGGLVGQKSLSEITNCYYDRETSKQNDEDCFSCPERGEGKTTAEMKQQETYTDWDFTNIWGIDPSINNGYPYLLDNY